ncbi:MAG TPA: serine/threonine-protein kinase [Candidatus Obscuribacterales bacterium]
MAQPDPKDTVASSVELTETRASQSSGGSLKRGQLIDAKYEILELSGSGGMSTVYRARQIFTKQILALKVLSPAIAGNADNVNRFRHEAKAVGKLNHPNIVRMYDFDVVDGLPYLTMDFVEGKSLSALIKENNGLSPQRTIAIFGQLCQALDHAHARGVLHRDLKPSNVIICQSGGQDVVKIVDFGIAKLESDETQGLTKTGEIFGSPFYMSPEQCQGFKLDARADIYSLGCMLFECLTGQPPFQGSNIYATIRMQMEELPAALTTIKKSLRGSVADELQAIVYKSMQKQASDRFQTTAELGEALDKSQTKSPMSAFLSKIAIRSQLKHYYVPRRDRLLLLLVLCALAVIVAVVPASAPDTLRDWFIQTQEWIDRPSGTPEQQWQTVMNRGMTHFNHEQFAAAETNLQRAAVLGKGLTENQETITLKQLRILYQIENNNAKKSDIEQQLNLLGQQESGETASARAMLLQAIALVPDRPNREQVAKIHDVISKALGYATQCELKDHHPDALAVLLPLQERMRQILPADDCALVDIETRVLWSQPDPHQVNSPALEKLSKLRNLTDWQKGLLALAEADNDFNAGKTSDAEQAANRAMHLLQPFGKSMPLGRAQEWVAYLNQQRDAYATAEATFTDAIGTYRALGSADRVALCTRRVARDMIVRGNAEQATVLLHKTLSPLNLERSADQLIAAQCYELLAYADRELGKDPLANSRKAIQLAQISVDPDYPSYQRALEYGLSSLREAGINNEVSAICRQLSAIATLRNPPDRQLYISAQDQLLGAYIQQGKQAQATKLFDKRLAEFLGSPKGALPDGTPWFTWACIGMGSDDQNKQVMQKLSSAVGPLEAQDPDSAVVAMRLLAAVQWRQSRPEAIDTYERAISFMSGHKVSGETQAEILVDYARNLKTKGDSAKAAEINEAAKKARAGGQLARQAGK